MPQTAALACLELWGGNHSALETVELPGLRAWVYASPLDRESPGGDLHYLSVCNMGFVSRVALADVSGHGGESAGFSAALHNLLRRYINHWDQSDLMRELNLAFREHAAASRKYATAVILGYYRETGELAFTNAGHPPPLWYRAAKGEWEWMRETETESGIAGAGLPVGLIPGTSYRQTRVALEPGDLLAIYTDGVTDSENRQGVEIGAPGLQEWARRGPAHSAEAAGRFLLEKLNAWREQPNDDETLIVLERQ